jgi:hypothetical protein
MTDNMKHPEPVAMTGAGRGISAASRSRKSSSVISESIRPLRRGVVRSKLTREWPSYRCWPSAKTGRMT